MVFSSVASSGSAPSLDVLERLVTSDDIRDRAFAAGVLSLERRADHRARVAALHERVRQTARRAHADLRRRIREGALDVPTFVAHLRATAPDIRDHLVEEILDIAYPPLEEASLPRDAIHYAPSGLDEVLFAIEHAKLGPGATLVDLGAGLGKVALLVAMLTGATTYGVEIDRTLVARARSAAESLGLDAHFIQGDIRDAPLPPADAYYMYIPIIRPAAVVERLARHAARRKIVIFSQALPLAQLPWLKSVRAGSYWLEAYESAL